VFIVRTFRDRFTIPGATEARVVGIGKRAPGTDPACPETRTFPGWEAQLHDRDTNELFEAELSGEVRV
jgi:hypothetical protein